MRPLVFAGLLGLFDDDAVFAGALTAFGFVDLCVVAAVADVASMLDAFLWVDKLWVFLDELPVFAG